MGDLTDSQVDRAAVAFLAAHPDDDRLGDALATGPAIPLANISAAAGAGAQVHTRTELVT